MENIFGIDLKQFRHLGDAPADALAAVYFSDKLKKQKLDAALKDLKQNRDWPAFLKVIPEAVFFDQEVAKITPPTKAAMLKAQEFYKGKAQYILQLLGLLSLPYCYAAADGAKVLYQTERMYKDVQKRLEETADFVTSVTQKNAFAEEGKAKVQIFKVRIMHAAARFYLKKSGCDEALGVPVNQEDMAGTNLSFSLIVIRGLRKMGFTISYAEQSTYINYWNFIGAMLGVNPQLLPKNGKAARDLDHQIAVRQFKPSSEGKALTTSLLNTFYSLNDQKQISNEEISAYMRFLLGNKVSDILGLPEKKFSNAKRVLLQIKSSLV
ncbi:MAG TPA: oxygenase MpaB family protein [Pelobium sp.]